MESTIDKIGLTGLYIFVLFSLNSITLATLGILLMSAALPFKKRTSVLLKDSSLAIFFISTLCFLAFEALRGTYLVPGSGSQQIKDGINFAKLWLFLLPAIWIKGKRDRAYNVLILSGVGLILGMLTSLDRETLHAILSGERVGFHLRITPFGLYSATGIIGLTIFLPRLVGMEKGFRFAVIKTVLLLALLLMLEGLIETQARGAWLALFVTLPVVAAIMYKQKGASSVTREAVTKGATVFLSIVLLLLALNYDLIRERIESQVDAFKANREYTLNSIPQTGIGHRFHLYVFALEKWRKQPLLGWGTGSTKRLISSSGRDDLKMNNWNGERVWFGHLHSLYFEFMVRFGLVGLTLAGASFLWLLVSMWRCFKARAMPLDIWLFSTGALTIAAIWSLFDFRVLHWDFRFYWMVVAGAGFSFVLTQRMASIEKSRGY